MRVHLTGCAPRRFPDHAYHAIPLGEARPPIALVRPQVIGNPERGAATFERAEVERRVDADVRGVQHAWGVTLELWVVPNGHCRAKVDRLVACRSVADAEFAEGVMEMAVEALVRTASDWG